LQPGYFPGADLPPAPEPEPLWDGLPLSVLPVDAGELSGFVAVRGGGEATGPFGTSSLAASASRQCATLRLIMKTAATADSRRLMTRAPVSQERQRFRRINALCMTSFQQTKSPANRPGSLFQTTSPHLVHGVDDEVTAAQQDNGNAYQKKDRHNALLSMFSVLTNTKSALEFQTRKDHRLGGFGGWLHRPRQARQIGRAHV